MKWAIRHARGNAYASMQGLTVVSGPFDSANAAITWAFNRWGPAGTESTVAWVVVAIEAPE